MKTIFILSFFFVFSAQATPCVTPMASPLSFQILKSTIQDCGLTTIEQVLQMLPEDYLSRYTLLHESRSLQQATAENPRVISFGTDASFILAFNNDPKLIGYDTLETTEFDRVAQKFIYREITFQKQNAKPVVSEDNPADCLNCHRGDPRPNWDSYFLWTGSFGAEDDSIFDHKHPAQPGVFPVETVLFQKYIRTAGRYAYLKPFTDAIPTPDHFPKGVIDYTSQGRHNLGLTTLIGSLNGERISRILANTPGIFPYRYLLLGAMACRQHTDNYDPVFSDWSDLNTFVPPALQKTFPLSQADALKVLNVAGRRSFVDRVERHFKLLKISAAEDPRIQNQYAKPGQTPINPTQKDYGDSPDGNDLSVSNMIWAVQPLGIDMNGWSTEFVGNDDGVSYSFHMISSGMGGAERPLWLKFMDPKADADLKPYFDKALINGIAFESVYFDEADLPTVCKILRQKSLAELSKLH